MIKYNFKMGQDLDSLQKGIGSAQIKCKTNEWAASPSATPLFHGLSVAIDKSTAYRQTEEQVTATIGRTTFDLAAANSNERWANQGSR